MNKVIFALGTNLGDKSYNIKRAHDLLNTYLKDTNYSSIIQTDPQYEINQDSFLNQVGYGYTQDLPLEVLKKFKQFENEIGRTPTYRFGPREIDIDILFYEDLLFESDILTIPHPRLHERSFVLQPLCELEPQWRCPKSCKTIEQLFQDLITL